MYLLLYCQEAQKKYKEEYINIIFIIFIMKLNIFILVLCCFMRNYFIHIKNKVKLPKNMPAIPYEMEPYEMLYLIYFI
jgi:hypothetical protein